MESFRQWLYADIFEPWVYLLFFCILAVMMIGLSFLNYRRDKELTAVVVKATIYQMVLYALLAAFLTVELVGTVLGIMLCLSVPIIVLFYVLILIIYNWKYWGAITMMNLALTLSGFYYCFLAGASPWA